MSDTEIVCLNGIDLNDAFYADGYVKCDYAHCWKCGHNAAVHQARQLLLKENGLTMRPYGLERLIIPKDGEAIYDENHYRYK